MEADRLDREPARRFGVGRQHRRGPVLAQHGLEPAPGLESEGL
jgi:hypothetical protein